MGKKKDKAPQAKSAAVGKKGKKSVFYYIEPYLYLLPALVLFFMFVFYPFVKTIVLSFSITTPTGSFAMWNGVQNYIDVFTDSGFWSSMWITFRFAIVTVILSIFLGFVMAIISNEKFPGRGFFRTVYSLPMAISAAAAAAMFTFILHPTVGTLNYVLHTNIGWLTDPKWALFSVEMVTVWMRVGINYIFLLAALQSVPKDLYESAALEGAGFFKKHWYITLPCVSPTMFFLLIINVISALQQYAQVRMMTDGGPSNSTRVIVFEIFEEAFTNGRFGIACTESVILFIIMMILTRIQFNLEKGVTY
ncbi:MAG: carbohydrate ABC transporter permease [Lachnospiraceae bacterium]|jgi:sn-glycerol 3-phosphate transport system permease protein